MHHEVRVTPDADAAAAAAADVIADRIRRAVAQRGAFTMAVSGGRSPWVMLGELAAFDLPWDAVSVWQVDERIAPDGDPGRNLVGLDHALGSTGATLHPMPVTDLLAGDRPDREPPDGAVSNGAASDGEPTRSVCDRYASGLPEQFDLIHLGLGPDGHTASLVPGDAVLGVVDHDVAVTAEPYQGRRRMTLTYPALERTDLLLWLVTGADKRQALDGLLAADPGLPASRVSAPRSVVVADDAAHPVRPGG